MGVTRDDYQKAFGRRFKAAMESCGARNEQVAYKAGVPKTAVKRYSDGSALPTVFVFAKICIALQLSAETVYAILCGVKR